MPKVGDINVNGQRLVAKTDLPGNHRFAKLWEIECTDPGCSAHYGANSCDFHLRRCPEAHGGGRPGVPYSH